MKFLIAAVIVFLIFAFPALSQCDCPGNVPETMIIINGPINSGRIMPEDGSKYISVGASLSDGNSLFAGSDEVENSYKRKFNYSDFHISAGYALTSRMNFAAEYRFNRMNIEDIYSNKKFNTHKLILSTQYNLFSVYNDDEFLAGISVKIPLSGEIPDSAGTAVSFSSNFALAPSISYNYMINGALNLIAIAGGNVNFASSGGYRTGNSVYGRILLRYNDLKGFYPALGVLGTVSAKDEISGKKIANSGGEMLSGVLSCAYSIPKYSLSVSVSGLIPLWRDVNGYQIPPEKTIEFGISLGV